MKIQMDELSILVSLDGLAQAKHPDAAVLEEIATMWTAEAILRELEAKRWEEELKLHRLLN